MEKNIDKLITQIQANFTTIKMCQNLDEKMKLIEKTYSTLNKFQKEIEDMMPGYKKNRFEKQLVRAKTEMKQLAIKTEEEKKMKSKVQDITLSIRKLPTIIGEQMMEEELQVMYNPRLTVEQNVLRNIVMKDIHQSNLMLKPEQIEEIARKMEATKGVIQEIAHQINEQGEQLDLITSQIQSANQNVKQARNNILMANEYQGGDAVTFHENGDLKTINGMEVVEPQRKTTKIMLNLNNSSALHVARMKMLSGLADFGFKIKSFFASLFGKNKD